MCCFDAHTFTETCRNRTFFKQKIRSDFRKSSYAEEKHLRVSLIANCTTQAERCRPAASSAPSGYKRWLPTCIDAHARDCLWSPWKGSTSCERGTQTLEHARIQLTVCIGHSCGIKSRSRSSSEARESANKTTLSDSTTFWLSYIARRACTRQSADNAAIAQTAITT